MSGTNGASGYGDTNNNGTSHNFGWIGLIGLAGLAGFFRGNGNRNDTMTNDRTTDRTTNRL